MRRFAVFAVVPMFVASLAGAAAPQRAFVSTAGADANAAFNCSLAAPCRSFDIAIGVVASDGEVVALDSGGYGRFTANKSVTVAAPPGVYAAISVFGGTDGIDINTPNVVVTLRGLTVNGQGGDDGVSFQAGASLLVENCVIGSMSGAGIRVLAAGSSNTFPSQTSIVGTTITRNVTGIYIGGGPASVTVSRSNVVSNGTGVDANGALNGVDNTVEVADTVVSNNTINGVLVYATVSGATIDVIVTGSTLSTNGSNGIYGNSVTGGTVLVTATGNRIVRNFNGISADGPGTAKLVVGQNTITRQRQGGVLVTPGVTVLSRGDNTINDNVVFDVFGSMGSIAGL